MVPDSSFYPNTVQELSLSVLSISPDLPSTIPPAHPSRRPTFSSRDVLPNVYNCSDHAKQRLNCVLAIILPFLTDTDQRVLHSVGLSPRWGPMLNWPLWPLTLHRRRFGFGADNPMVSASYAPNPNKPGSADTPLDVVSPELLGHFCWDFLSVVDRINLVCSSPVFVFYHRPRLSAAQGVSLASCRSPPRLDPDAPLPFRKAYLLSVALCKQNFVYADMFRWLGGTYNNKHRSLQPTFDVIDRVKAFDPHDRTWRLFHQGAPLTGHFSFGRTSVAARNLFDNYSGVYENFDTILAKYKKEEQLQYHLFLPCIMWRFLPGLFIALINWVAPKPHQLGDTGRLCIDPSSKISVSDDGNPNSQIPDAGLDPDANPSVAYGTAFERFLRYVYNLRLDHPDEDILLSADDISAAFRRVNYNQEVAVVFSCVLDCFLIIPVGMIFGAKNSPSYYMTPGELRAHLARHLPSLTDARTRLGDSIVLPPPPTPTDVATFVRVNKTILTPESVPSLRPQVGNPLMLRSSMTRVALPFEQTFTPSCTTASWRPTSPLASPRKTPVVLSL